MSLDHFINDALSPWMRENGPDSDIVMSSRIRLARNFNDIIFPIIAEDSQLQQVVEFMRDKFANSSFKEYEQFELVSMADLTSIEKRILIEKHLISPFLLKRTEASGMLISKNEQVSIMINEEDHIRLQLYLPGLQLREALEKAFDLDDWLEDKIDYAYDERWGYLSSCPTNTGTGMRASVMMHLPGLVMTRQMSRLMPAVNQLGLVVRGLYGEGSEARGNIFQISNQITMGKSESDIVSDLESIASQLIDQERRARKHLQKQSGMRLEDRIFRSYGVLQHSRILESKEAAKCLSDVRLGIDLEIIKDISGQILNELMILTQPGFLQHYAKEALAADNRDILRATLVRERLQMEN